MLLDPELHYLDNAATTMVDPEIAGAIHEALLKDWANPSSLYLLRQREQQPCRAGPCHGTQKLGQQNCGFRF